MSRVRSGTVGFDNVVTGVSKPETGICDLDVCASVDRGVGIARGFVGCSGVDDI